MIRASVLGSTGGGEMSYLTLFISISLKLYYHCLNGKNKLKQTVFPQ